MKRLPLIAGGIVCGLTAAAQIITPCNYFAAYEAGGFLAQAGPEWAAFPGVDSARADGRIVVDGGGPRLLVGSRTDANATDLVYSLPDGEAVFSFAPLVAPDAIMTVALSTAADLGEEEAYLLSVGSADLVNHLSQDPTRGHLYRLTAGGVDTLLSFDPLAGLAEVTLQVRDTGTQILINGNGGRIAELFVPEQLDRANFYSVGPSGRYEITEICPAGVVGTSSVFENQPLTTQTFRANEPLPARYPADVRIFDANGRAAPGVSNSVDLPVGLYYALFGVDQTLTRERWVVLP